MKVFIKHNKPTSIPGLYKESLKTGIHGKRAARYMLVGPLNFLSAIFKFLKKVVLGPRLNNKHTRRRNFHLNNSSAQFIKKLSSDILKIFCVDKFKESNLKVYPNRISLKNYENDFTV